jgi:hypothetical protein
MKTTLLASYERYRLVRYEPSGETRIEGKDGQAQSNWLSAHEVDDILGDPSLLPKYAGRRDDR